LFNVDLWIFVEKIKRKLKEYEQKKVFYDVCNAKLPWVELVANAHGKVHRVKCKVYTKITNKEKLLAIKLDNLWKHGGRRKALATILGVHKINDQFYMNKDFVHVKNEHLYVIAMKDTFA